jgi:hypothetical protein
MFDLIGAIASTAVYAVLVGTLVGLAPAAAAQKRIILAAAAAWGIAIVAVAALGGFAPGTTGPIAGPGLAVAGLVALLLAGWFFLPGFRDALVSVPLPVLVGLNVTRVLGVLFLIAAADRRLSAPFAPSAGWGDVMTGLVAIPLALMARRGSGSAAPLVLWNIFGSLDLIVAMVLGLLSAPGTPTRIFTEEPGTLAIGELPLVMIPAMLVPIYLIVHLTIAAKLRTMRGLTAAAAAAR